MLRDRLVIAAAMLAVVAPGVAAAADPTDALKASSPAMSDGSEPIVVAARVGAVVEGTLALGTTEIVKLKKALADPAVCCLTVSGTNYLLASRDPANRVVHGVGVVATPGDDGRYLLLRELDDASLLVVVCKRAGAVQAAEAVYAFAPTTSELALGAASSAVSWVGGWSNFGGEHTTGASVRIGDTVHVLGLAKPGTWGAIATVPAADKPAKQLIFHLDRDGAGARVDVLATGEVRWVIGGTGAWQSLTGIAYPLTSTPLTLASGLAAYGGAYTVPGYASAGGVVRLTGLVKGSVPKGTLITTLPADARPPATQRFGVSQHEAMAVVTVATNGEVRVERASTRGWISLDGVAFGTGGAIRQGIAGAAVPSGQASPAVVTRGAEIVLEGAVNKGTGALVTLPSGKRPAKRLVFHQPTDSGEARIDVLPDGSVVWVAGAGTWVSLSGISFPAG